MASPAPDIDDGITNCKACNLLLEEGKAYELAGYRWHIDCFKCCKCHQPLNSEANLLLLGDGSLICNGCTYTCEVCKSKIEDLAILTNDLAFCESCFRCRNCEKQIENLKYARTSHGIFCMECHDAQAASRRRRKARQAQQNRLHAKNMVDKYKALPALPPEVGNVRPEPYVDIVDPGSRLGRETEELSQAMQTLTLPATTYNIAGTRRSVFEPNELNGSDEGMYIPVTLDPTPVAASFPPDVHQLPHSYTGAPAASRFSSGSEPGSPDLPPRRRTAEDKDAQMPLSTLVQAPQPESQFGAFTSGISPSGLTSMDGTYSRAPTFKVHDHSSHSTSKRKSMSYPTSPALGKDSPAPSIRPTSGDLSNSPSLAAGGLSARLSSANSEAIPSIPARGDSLAASNTYPSSQTPTRDPRPELASHPERSSSRNDAQSQGLQTGFGAHPLDDDPSAYYAYSSLQAEWYPGKESSTDRSVSPASRAAEVQLEAAKKRIAELEAENNRLSNVVEKAASIKHADTVLEEKRLTMATLDSHREILMRELKAMNDEYERQKLSGKGVSNFDTFKQNILSKFSADMDRLKSQFQSEIEGMVKQRSELEKEITNLIQMKDKGFQEYEALSSRNAQLSSLNNQLAGSIQSQYRSGRSPDPRHTPGLGLDAAPSAPIWPGFQDGAYGGSLSGHDGLDAEVSIVESPQLVEIRKAKPKTKVWGRQIARGLKGALGIEKQPSGERYAPTGITEAGLPYNQLAPAESPNLSGVTRVPHEKTSGFGSLFASSNKANRKVGLGAYNAKANSSSSNLAQNGIPNELQVHYELEGNNIPRLITACVGEVEARGLDQQGIYRLSGSKSEVDELKESFDNKHPMSLSNLDIHVVSSVLKQYLRKLDKPLITYEVYDPLLEAARIQDVHLRATEMRGALDRLPVSHLVCLRFLLTHLTKVVSRSRENLMSANNLAIVFAPTLMRTEDLAREHSDLEIRGLTMQILIDSHDSIFPENLTTSGTAAGTGGSPNFVSTGVGNNGNGAIGGHSLPGASALSDTASGSVTVTGSLGSMPGAQPSSNASGGAGTIAQNGMSGMNMGSPNLGPSTGIVGGGGLHAFSSMSAGSTATAASSSGMNENSTGGRGLHNAEGNGRMMGSTMEVSAM